MSQNNKGEPKNQKFFIDAWLSDPAFEEWLAKEKDSKKKARYTVCHKSIEVFSSGRLALTDLAKGKKHKEIIEREKYSLKRLQPELMKRRMCLMPKMM